MSGAYAVHNNDKKFCSKTCILTPFGLIISAIDSFLETVKIVTSILVLAIISVNSVTTFVGPPHSAER
jgi:hypothetical protein